MWALDHQSSKKSVASRLLFFFAASTTASPKADRRRASAAASILFRSPAKNSRTRRRWKVFLNFLNEIFMEAFFSQSSKMAMYIYYVLTIALQSLKAWKPYILAWFELGIAFLKFVFLYFFVKLCPESFLFYFRLYFSITRPLSHSGCPVFLINICGIDFFVLVTHRWLRYNINFYK
jgi:hypothetical protein